MFAYDELQGSHADCAAAGVTPLLGAREQLRKLCGFPGHDASPRHGGTDCWLVTVGW